MSEQDPGDFVAYPVPVTRQNADRGENLDPAPAPAPVLVRPKLVFDATLTEPDSAAHFLGTGGALAAAAAPWTTSFAVSGDDGTTDPAAQTREPAVVVPLYQNQPTRVEIPLHPDGVQDRRDKLLVENNRQGAGINGTYGSFYAGCASQLLALILRNDLGQPLDRNWHVIKADILPNPRRKLNRPAFWIEDKMAHPR